MKLGIWELQRNLKTTSSNSQLTGFWRPGSGRVGYSPPGGRVSGVRAGKGHVTPVGSWTPTEVKDLVQHFAANLWVNRERIDKQRGCWFFPTPLCLSEATVFSPGTQIFWCIKGGCWAAKILVIRFHPSSMRNASLWNPPQHPAVLPDKNPGFPYHFLALDQAAWGTQLRREDGLFPSLRDWRMHSCACGRLPIMKEELITCLTPESLLSELFWVKHKLLLSLRPSLLPCLFSFGNFRMGLTLEIIFLCFPILFCFRIMEMSLFPKLCE